MKAEKLIGRNIEREGFSDVEQVLLLTPKHQESLTEEYILPNQEAVMKDMLILREEADAAIKDSVGDEEHSYGSPYPVGRCLTITHYVYRALIDNLNNPDFQGIRAIRKFIKEGGLLRTAWAIQDERFFQNVIQVGSSVLDVAEDTFDRNKAPVSFHENLRETGYKTVASLEKFAEVAEKYWNCRAYPNIYIPALAPYYPVILRKKTVDRSHPNQQHDIDGLYLDGGQAAIFNWNIISGSEKDLFFGATHDFLFESKYSDRRLPKEAYQALLDHPTFNYDYISKITSREFFVSDDPERAEEYLRAHYNNSPENAAGLRRKGDIAELAQILATKPIAIFPSSAKDNEQE